MGAKQLILSEEYAGLCVMYQAIHGEEDKQKMPNPNDEEAFVLCHNDSYNYLCSRFLRRRKGTPARSRIRRMGAA